MYKSMKHESSWYDDMHIQPHVPSAVVVKLLGSHTASMALGYIPCRKESGTV